MAIITTVGDSTANSFVDDEYADDYFEATGRLSEWQTATNGDPDAALLYAMTFLESLNWRGYRVDEEQALQWPRSSSYPWYGYVTGSGGTIGLVDGFSRNWPSNDIPEPIKKAQCELALAYLKGYWGGDEDVIKRFSADGLTVEYADKARPGTALPAIAERLLAPFLGSYSVGVKRLVRV